METFHANSLSLNEIRDLQIIIIGHLDLSYESQHTRYKTCNVCIYQVLGRLIMIYPPTRVVKSENRLGFKHFTTHTLNVKCHVSDSDKIPKNAL